MAQWVIRDDGQGWTVRRGRRERGFPTQELAVKYAEQECGAGDRIVLEEIDGYRIPLRGRRGWRR